jgi:predicted permease
MSVLRVWFQRFCNLFRKERLDRELDAELASHLEMHIEDNLRAGLTPEEARRVAFIKLGGLEQTKESHRHSRGVPLLEGLLQDLRFALRMLSKSRAFTVIAVVALALGIGFSTTIFSIFYNGVLHPFPYRDAERLTVISVFDTQKGSDEFRSMFHLDEVAAFRKQNHSFEDIVAYTGQNLVYSRSNFSEPVHACVVTPNAMDFWGVPPLLGRGLAEEDSHPGAGTVALLSYRYWKSTFHGDKAVLGTTMMLNGQAHTIIGVMPRRFLLYGADLYLPIAWNRAEPSITEAINDDAPMYFFATAILKRNLTARTADADIQVIAQPLAALHRRDYPEHFQMFTRPMNEVIVAGFKKTLLLLIAAVILLLLISASNVASLLLTHHSARAKEIALRAALGASSGRLIRQLLVESLALGFAGCFAGCLLAYLALTAVRLTPGVEVPGEADMSLNLPALFFAIAVSLLTTVLFGLSPTLFAVKKDLRTNLQGSGVNANASQGGARVRSGLVVGQVALSVLLLVFAGLMMRSFLTMTHFDLGFPTKGIFVSFVHFPPLQYESAESKRQFFDQVLPRIAALPGVTFAAEAMAMPLEGSWGSRDVTIPGKPHDQHWTTAFEACSEGYFQTLGLQLISGRLLSHADITSARRVAVVNRTLAKSYFANEDPIGRQIKFNELDELPQAPHDAYFEIVGVVSDFRNWGIQEPTLPQAFIPYTFSGIGDRTILARTTVNPSLLVNNIRQILAEAGPNTLMVNPRSLDDYLQEKVYSRPKFRLISFGACAAIGLGLALIGLFGVMSYSVALRTQEFGVRMALGAQPGNILMLVLRKGVLLVGSGLLLGLLVSFLSVRVLQSQLWGVSAFDAGAFVLAPLALLTAALLACYLPARRATRVDPMVALRYE